jgi:hypothetical protein
MAIKTPGDLSAFGIAFSQNRIGLSITTLIRTLARTSGSRALGRRNREACEEIGKAALGTVRFQRAGFELDPALLGRISRILASVFLIDESDLDCFTGLGLHPLGQFSNLSAVLLVGGPDTQGEQMSQGVDCQMDFIAFASQPPLPGVEGVSCFSPYSASFSNRTLALLEIWSLQSLQGAHLAPHSFHR